MENQNVNISAAPVTPIPAVVPIPENVPQPAVEQPKLEEGGKLSTMFNFKPEYVIITLLGIVGAAFTMNILYYRNGLKTNNSIQNLQNQIDQLKLSQKPN